MKTLGLALSGGGVRGVAHVGVIRALDEEGISPTHISGSSAGAIVGGLYANGVSWKKILHFLKTIPIFSTRRLAGKKPGFIDSEKFLDEFREYLPHDSFEQLQKKLFVTATDVINGELKIFNSGELIRPIIASASFPGVFSPIRLNDSLFIDGGVVNNFPVEPLIESCDKIIGVFVNPLKKIEASELKHSYNVLDRAYSIRDVAYSEAKFNRCDLLIYPQELSEFSAFNMKRMDTIFEIGYQEAKRILKKNGVLK